MGPADAQRPPTPRLESAQLKALVAAFINRAESFRLFAWEHGVPLYVFDKPALERRSREFLDTFRREVPNVQPFYAVKSNSYPPLARTLVERGFGLDVSSGDELKLALECDTGAILFSGPGKRDDELDLAVTNRDRVTVLIDSFAELKRLEQAAARHSVEVRAGVRLTTGESGIWRKFGIPLEELGRFAATSQDCPHVSWRGVQFHISWNMNPDNQVAFLTRLGAALGDLAPKTRQDLEFIDVGGGFWPPQGEWLQSGATPEGLLLVAKGRSAGSPLDHFHNPAVPLASFVGGIGKAVTQAIPRDMEFTLYCEPGRWLCHEAMHILVTVVDRKAADLVITDAGTNMVGWERFEYDYFPVINLTRPSLTERQCLVAGSLCTPHDIWGYSYFGADIRAGDLLLVPNQGAYTYSLRQHFIKPLPSVATLSDSEVATPAARGGSVDEAV